MHQQRVAVGRRLDRLGAEVAARAAAVLDHHGLADALGQLLRQRARHHVGRTARREGDDDAHPARPPGRGVARLASRPRRRSRRAGEHGSLSCDVPSPARSAQAEDTPGEALRDACDVAQLRRAANLALGHARHRGPRSSQAMKPPEGSVSGFHAWAYLACPPHGVAAHRNDLVWCQVAARGRAGGRGAGRPRSRRGRMSRAAGVPGARPRPFSAWAAAPPGRHSRVSRDAARGGATDPTGSVAGRIGI